LLLEYCDLGSLLYYTRRLHSSHEAVEEEFIWYVALSIGKALAYLHCGYGTEDYDPEDPWRRGYAIVHRDIKPENILMKTDLDAPESICVKLSDFGLASKLSLDARDNLAFNGGTYDWQPPEQVLPPHKAGPKQDMWALGAIIHYLALGEPPIDVAKADNKLKKGSEEWKRSIPRRVVCINEEPRLRQGIGNHENYDGDGAESWSVKYSDKLNTTMMGLLAVDPKERLGLCEELGGDGRHVCGFV
jgi:serine/threonine protein kinase